MLSASKLPDKLWAEAVAHQVWLRNHAPTKALPNSKTPLEMATGERPNLSDVHEWGCKVWVKRTHSPKLKSRVDIGRFIGFDEESKGYRIYWEDRRSVTVERDVYFNKRDVSAPEMTLIEGETHRDDNQLQNAVTPTENVEPPVNEDSNHQTVNATGKSVKNPKSSALNGVNPPKNGGDMTKSNIPHTQTSSKLLTPDPAQSTPICRNYTVTR